MIRESDIILSSAINSVKLSDESSLISYLHHESIFVKQIYRYLIRVKIDNDQLYSFLTFLMYVKNNLQLRHEYDNYIEMNFKYNDHFFFSKSEFNNNLMSSDKSILREEL